LPLTFFLCHLSTQVASLIKAREDLPPEDVLALQTALVNLGLRVYPDSVEYVDQVLEQVAAFLTAKGLESLEGGACAMLSPFWQHRCRALHVCVWVLVRYPACAGFGLACSASVPAATVPAQIQPRQ